MIASRYVFSYIFPATEATHSMQLIIIAAIAFCTSIVAGMLGLGGAVLLIPAYLYLPGLFGVESLNLKSISGMTSVQVFASSLMGAIAHRKRGAVELRLVLTMGIPITIASLTGALFSGSISGRTIIIIFALMAITGAVLMLIRRDQEDRLVEGELLQFNIIGAIVIASSVGFFGGIVGAPGAFLLSPLMMTVLRIPTRITIGSTLGIVLLSALAASVGKLATDQVPFVPSLIAIAVSLPGAQIGSKFSHRLKTRTLRWTLAIVIAGIGLQMLWKVLS